MYTLHPDFTSISSWGRFMQSEKEVESGPSQKLYKDELLKKGTTLYSAGRYEEALDCYTQAALSTHTDALAYVGMGDCLRKLKRFEEALNAFEEALAIDPRCIKAHIGKCYSYVKLGRVGAAFTAYRKAIKLEPQNAAAYNAKGQILRFQQQYDKALRAFERAIELERDTDNIAGFYYNKGLTLIDLGCIDDALSAYEQARQHNPENPKFRDAVESLSKNASNMHAGEYGNSDENASQSQSFATLGHAFFRQRKSGLALIAYDKAIALRTQDSQCYKNLASILVQVRYYEEAAYRYTQALRLDPQDASTHMDMGYLLIKLERYADALQMFNISLQLDSTLALGYAGKGHALFALHHDIEALKAYADAIDLHTSDPACYINSGDILNGLHFYEGAAQVFLQAIQYAPQSVSVYTGLGKALMATGQYTDAFVACVQAYYLDTTSNAVYQNLLDSIAAIYKRNDARSIFRASFEKLWEKLDAREMWSLISLFSSVHAAASIQYTLLQHFIIHAPRDEQVNEALGKIANLWDDLFETSKLAPDTISHHVEMLHALLLHLSEAQYADALTLIANSDMSRIAHLLIHLAPYSLSGLASLAHQITLSLVPTRKNDSLIYRFCDVWDAYGVPDEDVDWLFARQLMVDEMYLQARSILFQLVKTHATPDSLWMLTIAMEHCDNPASEQIDVLHQFIASAASSDTRLGDAWKRIGNLSWEMREGLAAIEAFEQAALCNCVAPQLELYRSGKWDSIPGFEQHPDFLFPPVVVIDVESDYAPDAEDGSRIFQIAAVRMKGRTELEHCDMVVKRDFVSPKVAHRQDEAIEPEGAARLLQRFIGPSIVVGHNIEAFDAKHLRGMDVTIDGAQIIDTLTFARLLYHDSVHHSLGLLCHEHHIPFKGDQHTALPDARACGSLLIALGDEVVCRGEPLLAGFRAFVPPGSAFDKAVLQPRGVPADPAIQWKLDPAPAPPRILAMLGEGSTSPHIVEAVEQEIDALVERYDPSGAYVQHLPSHRRAVVTVDSRVRLERMLALAQDTLDLFVLPDPQTLLCPDRLRHCIKHEQHWEVQLALFCLYLASHNHDARTLYPLRLPFEEFAELRQVLLSACCASEWRHPVTCPGRVMAQAASESHCVLFATHEVWLHWPHNPEADLIIVDDVGALQMHFAEHLAERISSEQICVRSPEVFSLLDERIISYVRHSMSSPGLFERLHLHSIAPLLMQPLDGSDGSFLSKLKTAGPIGEEVAGVLEMFCQQEAQEATDSETLHACWLELRTGSANLEYLLKMEQAMDRMELLINDLLNTSLVEADTFVLHRRPCDLLALCQQVLREYLAEPIEGEVDVERISQVLLNLLSNARKYSSKEAPITVRLERQDQHCRISVQDRGVGIPAQQLPHLFERFYQVPGVKVQTGSSSGVGLGLYIVQKIVERHGGVSRLKAVWGKAVSSL
jgi:signal transduction histidine kinase/tetratricopeptide (TPR) repeat protein